MRNAGRLNFEKLVNALKKIVNADNEEEVFREAQQVIHEIIPHDAFLGALVDEDKGTISYEYVLNVRNGFVYSKHTGKLNGRETLTGWVATNRKTLLIGDTSRADELPANLRLVGEPMLSWLGVPVIYEGRVMGVISVQSREKNGFKMDDVYIMEILSNFLAPVLAVLHLKRKMKNLEQLVELLENALTPVAVIQDGKFVYVNSQSEKFVGYRKEELIGREFTVIIHPDDRDKIREYYRRRIRGVYAPPEYMAKFVDKNGNMVWGYLRAQRIKWHGRWATAATVVDVTELKRYADSLHSLEIFIRRMREVGRESEVYKIASEALREISGADAVFVAVLDENNKLIVAESLGYEEREIRDVISKSADVLKSGKNAAFRMNGSTAYVFPVRAGRKTYGIFSVKTKNKLDESLVNILAYHTGLTIRTFKLQKKLIESKNLQMLMVRIVGHDIINNLSVIKGYAELLQEEYNPRYIEEIIHSVEDAIRIVEKAKMFSKIDSYHIEEKREIVDLRKIAQEMAEEIKRKYPDAVISISGDAKVRGFNLLKNVFSNLLDNAFKYGASAVEIRIKKSDDRVRVEIADNGRGIPRERRKIIFNAYKQLKSQDPGAGLGLWIVKKIVDLHGGRIWVEENKPKGSVFIVELPKD